VIVADTLHSVPADGSAAWSSPTGPAYRPPAAGRV